MALYLLGKGVKVKKDKELLHIAAEKGLVDMMKLLTKYGAKPHKKNFDNKTPLHCAARQGHLPAVKYLVEECNVDINVRKGNKVTQLGGKTAKQMAESRHLHHIVQYLEQVEVGKKTSD